MNIFEHKYVRLLFLGLIIALQVGGLIFQKNLGMGLLLGSYILCIPLGFFSLTLKQSISNGIAATIATPFIVTLALLISSFFSHKDLAELVGSSWIPFAVSAIALISIMPLLLAGYGVRFLLLRKVTSRS